MRGPRRISPKYGVCRSCIPSLKRGSVVHGSPEHIAKMRAVMPDQRGAKNRAWKGGRHIDSRGYVTVVVEPDDTIGMAMVQGKAGHAKYGWNHVHEHRLVIAHAIGRPLLTREQVHHVDGDKTNNALENLRLFSSRAEHMQVLHLAVCPHCGKSLR